ncbi:MAG: flavin reductase [Oscillospiraceae bacterium]|jgi:flavin reductase (DIM6/NTAB) family NADH-FMN oxidoreductase RutF|nr:flavin reductase [Oscillospiraceae bacterium]
MSFQQINVENYLVNAVTLFRDTWGLLTAGTSEKCNMMTVSWGMLGELWGEDCVMVFVRPQRYTKEFLDANERFSLSFLPKGTQSKRVHGVCGVQSGRDIDKIAAAGLTPVPLEDTTCFAEAETVLLCRKLAAQDFEPSGFISDIPHAMYPEKDFHTLYVGKIEQILVQA